jgi:uncharacterized protein (UPF0332 family)
VPLSGDLLAQARHLALKESKKPLQASLRRAVSAAYYSLFHFLVENATRFLIAGNQTERRRMREQLGRSFSHDAMKKASVAFAKQNRDNPWVALFGPVPTGLQTLATAFVELQEARHDADYNLARLFTRLEVIAYVKQAEVAMAGWGAIRDSAQTQAYLVSLLAQSRR